MDKNFKCLLVSDVSETNDEHFKLMREYFIHSTLDTALYLDRKNMFLVHSIPSQQHVNRSSKIKQ